MIAPRSRLFLTATLLLGLLAPMALTAGEAAAQRDEPITLYCGRSQTLVEPIIRKFTEETGIEVRFKSAKTAQVAMMLEEEGERSPADVVWCQDAGTLGSLAKAGHFAELPESLLATVPEGYQSEDDLWVGTSGRLRVLAYAPDRVSEEQMPASVFDLTDPKYKGRVGWAPTNASFIAFVTALRKTHGEAKAKQWLEDMKANDAKAFPKNTAIVMGIANGEVDFGLPNHYYLLRFKTADRDYPVEQTQFEAGDIGNMNNVAGVGLMKASDNKDNALKLIAFLLSPQAQQYFVGETFEIPISTEVIAPTKMFDLESVRENLPEIDLDELHDLKGTQELLREVGLAG
jgi:iron(III) transport system substrate-binding protein